MSLIDHFDDYKKKLIDVPRNMAKSLINWFRNELAEQYHGRAKNLGFRLRFLLF